MDAQISSSAFSTFFAWAPLVAGIVIYGVFYAAKRHEATENAVPIGQTYACAQCGRRALREHMTPRQHAGAVSWYCSRCASGLRQAREDHSTEPAAISARLRGLPERRP